MKIRCGFEIRYDCPAPAPLIFMINVRPEREPDLLTPQTLTVDPPCPVHTYKDLYGNVCTRVRAPAGVLTLSSDFIVQDSGEPDPILADAVQHAVEDLPDEALLYLLGSRYCETDLLSNLAWDLFGQTPPGWPRVQAIIAYAHERITFGYGHARATRTAAEGHSDQVGVCRDYAHLAAALCRCMNIPARYCTGYLGDIGVPLSDTAMDFSAWIEVFLSGRWVTFDARHNRPRIGRILMAVGRDATDVAIATTFGATTLTGFKVVTDELE